MADTAISLTAIVVSGVVGPSLSAWWSRRRQRDDHQRELRVELVAVLDEGVHALGQANRCYMRIYRLHANGVDRESAQVRAEFVDRSRLMQNVRYGADRIAMRLGVDHAVHRAYIGCVSTLDGQYGFADAYREGSVTEQEAERGRRAHERFDPARAAFVDAARQLVGPRLD
jgi:hypothetical protein